MASFVLQWLHKLENNKNGRCINPCKCSRYAENEGLTGQCTRSQNFEMWEPLINQGEVPQSQAALQVMCIVITVQYI